VSSREEYDDEPDEPESDDDDNASDENEATLESDESSDEEPEDRAARRGRGRGRDTGRSRVGAEALDAAEQQLLVVGEGEVVEGVEVEELEAERSKHPSTCTSGW
jgi:hypothetical protein